jgi:hypothetical protein
LFDLKFLRITKIVFGYGSFVVLGVFSSKFATNALAFDEWGKPSASEVFDEHLRSKKSQMIFENQEPLKRPHIAPRS